MKKSVNAMGTKFLVDDPCIRLSPSTKVSGVAWAIKNLRQKRKVSARNLSIKAGLSSSYVSKVENGEIEPSFKAFAKIATALDMTTLEIMFCVLTETDLDGKSSYGGEFCSPRTETEFH